MIDYSSDLKSSGDRVKVQLNLSNHETKVDAKNVTGADTSKFAKKFDFADLKCR